jgi:hypothetical protein
MSADKFQIIVDDCPFITQGNDCLPRARGYLLRPHSAVGLDDNDLADLLNRFVLKVPSQIMKKAIGHAILPLLAQ